jgi:hypothetical protein
MSSRVFYYQHEGKTHLVCVSPANAGPLSPIWKNCNTCSWLVDPEFEIPAEWSGAPAPVGYSE